MRLTIKSEKQGGGEGVDGVYGGEYFGVVECQVS